MNLDAVGINNGFIPVGAIICYSSEECPEGYLPCDGREVFVDEYPELYEIIGHTYGTPLHSNGFLLPNLCNSFVRGFDSVGNVDAERLFGSYQQDSIQGHAHIVESTSTRVQGEHDHPFEYKDSFTGLNLLSNGFSFEPCLWGDETESIVSVDSYVIKSSGIHEHIVPERETVEIISSKYNKVKVDDETRPVNMSLLYCIRVK